MHVNLDNGSGPPPGYKWGRSWGHLEWAWGGGGASSSDENIHLRNNNQPSDQHIMCENTMRILRIPHYCTANHQPTPPLGETANTYMSRYMALALEASRPNLVLAISLPASDNPEQHSEL